MPGIREETRTPPRTFSEVSFLLCKVKEHNYTPFANPDETREHVKQKTDHDTLCLSGNSLCSYKRKQNVKAFNGITNVISYKSLAEILILIKVS